MKNLLGIPLLCLLCSAGFAGSLVPPGPPAPTMKTMSQVEPRTPIQASDIPLTINQSGSYYFASDITITTPVVIAITVDAPSVTIDLNGFALSGPSQTGETGIGIYCSDAEMVAIKNGTVRSWGSTGVHLFEAADALVENVAVTHTGENGIWITTGTVRNCTVMHSGKRGILQVNSGSGHITGNKVSHCGLAGISVQNGYYIITDNVCSEINGSGIYLETARCQVRSNHCSLNVDGILSMAGRSTIDGNSVTFNSNAGIRTSEFLINDQCLIIRNNSVGNETNYIFAPTTRSGPIVQPVGAFTSSNPWTNFSN